MGATYSSFKAPDPTEQILFWAHSCNFKGMCTGKHNASTSRLGRPKPEKHFLSFLIHLLETSLLEGKQQPNVQGTSETFVGWLFSGADDEQINQLDLVSQD